MKRIKNEYLPLLGASVFIGIVVGLIVGAFNYVAKLLIHESESIYTFIQANLIWAPAFFVVLIALALLMAWIHKKNKAVRGGGMAQTIAMCKGEAKYNWWQVLWGNITCSFMSFFGGLPLGAEGPSMFLGSAAADGAWKTMKFRPYTRKYLLSAGASSGLAATFNAPLAGLAFTIEKVHRRFNPMLLLVVGIAVVCSTLVINALSGVLGISLTLFSFSALLDIPLEFYWMLLGLGIVVGLGALGFQLLLTKSQKFFDKKEKQFPYWARLLCAFVLTGAFGLITIDAISGGHAVIEKIASMDFAVLMLLGLLAIKLFLISICYVSGATGGLFIPSLCIGAILGGIVGHGLTLIGLPAELYSTIVCISMMGFLAGTTRAPISALILLLELTGFSGNILPAAIVVIVAFVMAQMFTRKSLYEEQVDRIKVTQGHEEETKQLSQKVKLSSGSVLIGWRVSDVFLPCSMDITSIWREGEKIVSDSETRFKKNDEVEFAFQEDDKVEAQEFLDDISK